MRQLRQIFLGILLLTVSASGKETSQELALGTDFEKTIHVNTNDFISDEVPINDTLAQPELSVTFDYEKEGAKEAVSSLNEQEFTDYYQNADGEKFLVSESSSFHTSGFQPQMTDIEFSEWYFLFLTPVNNQTAHTDLTQKTRASAARELTESLSRKLKVQTSEFRIISIEEYASQSISVNLSLVSRIQGLHRRLCRIPVSNDNIFTINNNIYSLVQIFHDKNQHLYINTNSANVSTLESVGLFVTLSLGGLGMFLVVLSVTFLFAKMVTKPADFERFGDSGENLMEPEEYMDYVNLTNDRKEIFYIEEVEETEGGTKVVEMEDCETQKASGRDLLSAFWSAIRTGRLKEKIFAEKFIELKP